jgi:hypothetical protein
MISPKQEAEQLVREMYAVHSNSASDITLYFAKQCALIAVDEICEILEDNGFTFIEYHDRTTIEYWLQVRQEIEKL